MGFFDNLRDALGGDKDDDGTGTPSVGARHVDRDAPAESGDGPHITGGKHAQRD